MARRGSSVLAPGVGQLPVRGETVMGSRSDSDARRTDLAVLGPRESLCQSEVVRVGE